MQLQALGFSQFFMSQINDFESEIERIGRVVAVHRGLIEVFTGKQTLGATCPVAIEPYPTVGDFVVFTRHDLNSPVLIERVFERKSFLSRKSAGQTSRVQAIASNVDRGLIVTSANDEFNLSRLERYILAFQDAGIDADIVVNKIDLVDQQDEFINSLQAIRFAGMVFAISAQAGTGFAELRNSIEKASTLVVVGSSGVGKSTLINRLCGEELLKTSAISNFSKGSHTTTSRHLVATADGAWIIDTPGMREFYPVVDSEVIEASFEDIAELASQCRYRNCSHTSEDHCAILLAISDGRLDQRRLRNYEKLKREQKRLEDRGQYLVNSKQKWKKIHKQMRARRKFESRND